MDMSQVGAILLAFGVPSALFGLIVWYFKRLIVRNQKRQEEHEKNLESLVLMMLQSERANTILCKATAEAVRDGHCNGNMTAAMDIVNKAAAAEKEFLLDKSIKYIFE
jgi:hypothetical protein